MSYLGKVYKLEKHENLENFLKAVGFPEHMLKKYLEFKPTNKIEKDGDTYTSTSTTPEGTTITTFKSGVEFDEMIRNIIPIKTTYVVDGNTITHTIKSDKGFATFKKEYNGDELVVTITSNTFDGVAKEYFRA